MKLGDGGLKFTTEAGQSLATEAFKLGNVTATEAHKFTNLTELVASVDLDELRDEMLETVDFGALVEELQASQAS